jgi:protein TonB
MEMQLTTRAIPVIRRDDALGGDFARSLLLHGSFVAVVFLCAWIAARTGKSWGDASATAGAVQATMVDAIPLPPRQPTDQDSYLSTETVSAAPITSTAKTVETPPPDAVPITTKTPPKPLKTADKTTPPPPLHPQPITPDPTKAQSGESTGIRAAISSLQTRAGTTNIQPTDAAFGARFAYYVQQITQKVAAQWYTNMLDPQAAGHRVYITFQVQRDGTPTNVRIAQRSGDFTLDQTALKAVQRIDTFGPLPEAYTGSHIEVTYFFDPPPHQ